MRLPTVRWGLTVSAVSLVLLTTSCAAEAPADDVQPESSVSQESSESPSTDQSDEIRENEELEGALVSSFPSDVPLYDGVVVNSLANWDESAERFEWNALLSTTDAMDVVDPAIRETYSANGWKIGTDMESGGGYMLVAHSEDYIVSLTYNDMLGPDITINYGVSPKF